jgi:hypothetical protein
MHRGSRHVSILFRHYWILFGRRLDLHMRYSICSVEPYHEHTFTHVECMRLLRRLLPLDYREVRFGKSRDFSMFYRLRYVVVKGVCMIAAGFIGLDSHPPYDHIHYHQLIIMSNFLTFSASVREIIEPFRISFFIFDINPDRH